jgi:hypothetical protein
MIRARDEHNFVLELQVNHCEHLSIGSDDIP